MCPSCYYRLARSLTLCPSCGDTRVLAFFDRTDQRVCASCVGALSPFACQQCGREGHPYGSRCASCVLRSRATALLSEPDGTLHPGLRPVLEALMAVDRPKSALNWLRRSDGPKILRAMALGEVPVTHEALDGLDRNPTVDHLRDLLVAAGVLPERQVHLERLGPWLDGLLADRPAGQARIVRLFATWRVLQRMRTKAANGSITSGQAHRARMQIRVVADFLAWLDDQNSDLASLRQTLFDCWLAQTSTTRHQAIAGFVAWAADRRLIGNVRLPPRHDNEPNRALADDRRWELVDRLLHHDETSLELRVAGLFILLFGQFPAQVAHMTVDQITVASSKVEVRFGESPITLPTPLDNLVRALLERRGHSSYPGHAQPWLFPGGAPGRPITAGQLALRLRSVGLTFTRPARNAALMQLAAEIPASVLADLVGIHPITATSWAALVKQDWAAYAAQRAAASPSA